MLQAASLPLNLLSGPWAVGGDWNITPWQLQQSGWLELVGGVVIAPTGPTCNESVYEYFVVSESLMYAVNSNAVVRDAGLEPHSPVRLFLRHRPRLQMVRQLVKPNSLPAKLPFGPEVKPSEMVCEGPLLQEYIDKHGSTMMGLVENALNEVAGFDEKQVANKPSRLEGQNSFGSI